MTTRIPIPDPDTLSDDQRKVYDAIAGGPRGGVRGPFLALLHSPDLADRVQHLGAFLRYDTSLGPRLSELAILVTARHWTCQYEWLAHEPHARKAGLADGVIDAIREGRRPSFSNPDELVVYDYCRELHETRDIGDETHAAAVEAFGVDGTVELTALCGYYTLIAMTLNANRVPLPDGAEPPLAPR